MKIYKFKIEKEALKFLNKQDKRQRKRLYSAIYNLPNGTDIKKLKGYNQYRLRVGDYRILYKIDNGIYLIDVIDIDSRGDVYKRI